MEKQSLNQIEDNSEWYNALIQEMNEKYNDDPELDSQFWERAQKKAQTSGITSSESKTQTVDKESTKDLRTTSEVLQYVYTQENK